MMEGPTAAGYPSVVEASPAAIQPTQPMVIQPELTAVKRLASIDAYRGLVMFLMMAPVVHLASVAAALPGSKFWAFLAQQQTHVEWVGCSLHDMIQPSFTFLVGVALAFSIAKRKASGQSPTRMTLHAFWRAFVLIALGIFLRSMGKPQTYFTFEDTLTQIGLGYGFLFILAFRPVRDQWIALGLILVGYWAAFALYPVPGPDFDYVAVGVSPKWQDQHLLTGSASHWNNNSNLAWAFDTWFLNLFPRKSPFQFNAGGYATLNFIPTLGTMILGLLAGGVLRSNRSEIRKIRWLVLAAVVALAGGMLLDRLGVCPIVKRIWTPSWTLYSSGWCFLLLAAFYTVMDIWGFRHIGFPLIVIGMNSIVAYCMAAMCRGFFISSLNTHLGAETFQAFGRAYSSLLQGGALLLAYWLILYWMYRHKVFVKI